MTLVLTCDGLAESDRAVLVVVGEANPITGAGQTGEDGAFTFTYRGSRSGQDSVRFLYPESGDVEAQTVSDLTEVTSSVVWVGAMQDLPTTSDTGETPVPLSVEDIASLADDDVTPQELSQKLLDYALGYNADWVDVEALGVDPMPTDNSSYNRIILDIPSKPQVENYYCGPATTQQVLAYLGVTKSQSTLASDQCLGTGASKNTYFPRVKKVLNKLVDETYTRSVVKDTTDMINYLNYGWNHNQPGAYHVMLHAQFFSYLVKEFFCLQPITV